MSIVSRIALAALACASLSVQAAPAFARVQAAADDSSRDTRGRFLHAGKCTLTFGFGGDCDKDAPLAKVAKEAKAAGAAKEAERAAASKAPDDNNTRGRLVHASKCVMSFGFTRGCDKDQADASAAARRADATPATPATPDTSTRGRLLHASKCITTLGFGGGCDKGDTH